MNSLFNKLTCADQVDRRELVFLNPEGVVDTLYSQIRLAGWEIHATSSATTAVELIDRHNLYVGLIVLDEDFLNRRQHQIEHLLMRKGHVQWVALITPTVLEMPITRSLIVGYFYDYHTLPVDELRLLNTLGHAYGMAHMSRSIVAPLPTKVKDYKDYEMVGISPAIHKVFRTIRKFASVDSPVIITGETGTGKELAARAIHERSDRSANPFVAVNCGALPANLIQAELFGHEKGAFTGAHQRKIGRIEAANGGTLFLDEIGDLSLDLQVNLLRFLQEGTIERLGSSETISVDIRVIAATHVNLQQAIDEGRFRSDLYYRLNVLHLELPSLRERKEDIEVLAYFFFQKFSGERNPKIKGFSPQALRVMNNYDWPGNIRELINRIRRAIVMCEHRLINPIDLGLDRRTGKRSVVKLEEIRGEAEKQAIKTCLRFTGNNLSEAAREMGISRVTLYRLIEKHDLANEIEGIDSSRN